MKTLMALFTILLSACGAHDSGAPEPDYYNDGFYITIDSEHSQIQVSKFIHKQWELTVDCMNVSYDKEVRIHIVNSSRVAPNSIGSFSTPDYIKIISADIERGGSVLRHEFEHYIKYHVYGDVDSDHSNFIGC